jgi:glycosyltransferase involved in cell wall biosynthesis
MRVLMFGWELPPYNSGGLGTACLGLTEGLTPLGVSVDFVVPKVHGKFPFNHMTVHSAADYSNPEEIEAILNLTPEQQEQIGVSLGYGNRVKMSIEEQRAQIEQGVGSLDVSPEEQSSWYAYQATAIANQNDFELILCHDWMTYYSGIAAKAVAAARGEVVPFIAHVHATEVDRCGGNPANGDQAIMAIEKAGLEAADHVVAVSNYTKKMVHKHYGIPLKKISVVHNGIPSNRQPALYDLHELKKKYKIALFMGRLTIMKGPDYFIKVAKAVTDKDPNVKFILIGSGDMEKKCIEQAAAAGLTGKILFSTFLRGTDVDRAYQLADLFIMPSVSEPFGIVALEAMQNGTPVLASKQSGVAEVSTNMMQIDFWDVDTMQEAVLHLLNNPDYARQLREGGKKDIESLTWNHSAHRLQEVYASVISSMIPKALANA